MIKKSLLIFVITAIVGLLFIFPSKSIAQDADCTNIAVSPTTGPSNTAFTLTANGCAKERNYSYQILDSNGEVVQGEIVSSDVDGKISKLIGNIPAAGQYRIRLVYALTELGSASFTITSVILPKCCADPQNPASCDKVGSNSDLCDPKCPSMFVPDPSGGYWVCAATDSSYTGGIFCNKYGYSVGEPGQANGFYSAIGCIPINNINEFAGFMAQRAALIIGGICMLLLILGGFKILTSQGNSQQIVDGQQLMVAAIGGVVLLIFGFLFLRTVGGNILGLIQ